MVCRPAVVSGYAAAKKHRTPLPWSKKQMTVDESSPRPVSACSARQSLRKRCNALLGP